jgi:N-methylhydantoinase A
MGGTSTDVSIIRNTEITFSPGLVIDGLYVKLPSIDIHSVGAGGGSIAWIDAGGALRVGPKSAGADPGPACYARGGTHATVTDANLILGYLSPAGRIGGIRLNQATARKALRSLRLGVDDTAVAEGIVSVANAEMARAIRVVTARAGVDPRDLDLLAFGGAGPLHAVALADELGMRSVIVPAEPGVLSALGLALTDRRFDMAKTLLTPVREIDEQTLRATVASLRALAPYTPDQLTISCALRYRGQSFELEVPYQLGEDPSTLVERFHTQHQNAYGFSDTDADVQLVTVRIGARQERGAVAPPRLRHPPGSETRRPICILGKELDARVLSRPPQEAVNGPAVIEVASATCLVPPGWRAEPLSSTALRLARQ